MNRRVFLGHCVGGVFCAVFTASAAVAESFQSSVVAQLRGQGYGEINVETTMLGRVRIVAARGGASREIILNPRTGEILRDVVLAADGRVEPEIAGVDGSGKGSAGDDGSEGSGDGSGDDGSGDDGAEDGDSGGHGDGKDGDSNDSSGKGGDGAGGGDDSED